MELQMAQAGETCKRCRYHGPMDHGSMDRINEVRKRFSRGGTQAPGLPSANAGANPNSNVASPARAGAPSVGGGLSSMSASIKFDPVTPKPIPSDSGNKMLAERLKALKGKSTGDVEFL